MRNCSRGLSRVVRAIVPALEAQEGRVAAKREAAERKALLAPDSSLEFKGATPVVEVALDLGGREIADPEALERLLDEPKSRILRELEAHHRVRLK